MRKNSPHAQKRVIHYREEANQEKRQKYLKDIAWAICRRSMQTSNLQTSNLQTINADEQFADDQCRLTKICIVGNIPTHAGAPNILMHAIVFSGICRHRLFNICCHWKCANTFGKPTFDVTSKLPIFWHGNWRRSIRTYRTLDIKNNVAKIVGDMPVYLSWQGFQKKPTRYHY